MSDFVAFKDVFHRTSLLTRLGSAVESVLAAVVAAVSADESMLDISAAVIGVRGCPELFRPTGVLKPF